MGGMREGRERGTLERERGGDEMNRWEGKRWKPRERKGENEMNQWEEGCAAAL